VTELLRIATFLAPNMLPVYAFIAGYLGRYVGYRTELVVGTRFDQFAAGEIEVGFICGLPYVQLMRLTPSPVALLAAPVLTPERYGDRPVYFSDVIVRRGSEARAFADLRGRSWAYNDPDSHLGSNLTRFLLARMGETRGFFRNVIEAGFHQQSIQMEAAGEVDAAAIDSHVLAIELSDHPTLSESITVIDTFGPSTIQPVVAANHLPDEVKGRLRAALYAIGNDPAARADLTRGFVDRFVPVADADYDDIRRMLVAAEEANFLRLH